MGKRKAEPWSEVGSEAKSAEPDNRSAEAPTQQDQTVHTASSASPVRSQGVLTCDGAGTTSDVAPQGVEGCTRYRLPTDPIGTERLTSPTVTEETASPTAVAAKNSAAANWFWLLLERAGYEVW